MGVRRRSPRGRPGPRHAVGLPDAGAGRGAQPDRAGVRAAGPPRAGTAGPPARTAAREGRTGHRGGRCPRRNGRRTGDAARRRDRRDACRATPPTSSRPTARTARSGAPSASRCTARTALAAAATALFRAPLWELLGTRRYGIYGVDHPEGPGTFLPAGRDDRWLYGVQYDADREGPDDFTVERFTRLIRLGAGVPGPDAPHRADRHVHVRRPTRRRVSARTGCSWSATPRTGLPRAVGPA